MTAVAPAAPTAPSSVNKAKGLDALGVILVDFQPLSQETPESYQVSYFMGAGPLPELRCKIERDVVDEYLGALDQYSVKILNDAEFWQHYCRDAYAGIIMSVIASQIVGASERSEAMFAAMASRHTQHALDLGSEALV